MKKIIILGLLGTALILSVVMNFRLLREVKIWRQEVIPRNTGNAERFVNEVKKKQKNDTQNIRIKGKLLKYDLEHNLLEIFSEEINDKIIIAFDEHTIFSVQIIEEKERKASQSAGEGEDMPEVPIETIKDNDVVILEPPHMEISFLEINYLRQPVAFDATFVIYIR